MSTREPAPKAPPAVKCQMPLPLSEDFVEIGPPAPALRHRAAAPLPGGSEWTFGLVERYDREIARIADSYGLSADAWVSPTRS